MIVGLLQLGEFLGTAWCIGHLFEKACTRNDRPGPPRDRDVAERPTPPPPHRGRALPPASVDVLPVRPACPVLVVPVGAGDTAVVRLFRTPLGAPTAVGFTTVAQLHQVLGADQAWVHLAEPALRALVGPLGVARVVVDPTLAAPATAPSPLRTTAVAAGPAVPAGVTA